MSIFILILSLSLYIYLSCQSPQLGVHLPHSYLELSPLFHAGYGNAGILTFTLQYVQYKYIFEMLKNKNHRSQYIFCASQHHQGKKPQEKKYCIQFMAHFLPIIYYSIRDCNNCVFSSDEFFILWYSRIFSNHIVDLK